MTCKWCNKEVIENAKFCTNCGGNLMDSNETPKESTKINNTTINNINSTSTQINSKEGKVNVWLVVLSCLIPLAGLIIFLACREDDKKTAKASGIAALISFVIGIIISVVLISFVTISTKNLINNFGNNVQDYIEEIETEFEGIEETIDEDITGTDWDDYVFTIDDTTLKLPTTYSALSTATSSVINSAQEKSYIQPQYYALANMYRDSNLALYIELLNDKDTDQLYTDCKVTRVTQTKYQVSVGAKEIVFPGGLKVGQKITKEEIIDILGTPSDIDNYSSDGYNKDTYSYYEDSFYTTVNYYKISVVNGEIDELSLDNRNYE